MSPSVRNPFFIIAACLLISLPGKASETATSLTLQITQLINQQQHIPPNADVTQRVIILTPPTQLSGLCAKPQLSLSGSATRLTGNRTVLAQCGQQRKFIQVSIDAQGSWFVSRRVIPAGTIVQPSDIEIKKGSFKHLPAGVLLSTEQIVGQTATRVISPGQPLIQGQLRKQWRITRGQQVDINASGSGFLIRTTGVAQNNAATGERLRIKTRSGQIISGLVTADGKVKINLDE